MTTTMVTVAVAASLRDKSGSRASPSLLLRSREKKKKERKSNESAWPRAAPNCARSFIRAYVSSPFPFFLSFSSTVIVVLIFVSPSSRDEYLASSGRARARLSCDSSHARRAKSALFSSAFNFRDSSPQRAKMTYTAN